MPRPTDRHQLIKEKTDMRKKGTYAVRYIHYAKSSKQWYLAKTYKGERLLKWLLFDGKPNFLFFLHVRNKRNTVNNPKYST